MNEDFVSFDIAKKLKEKGFNIPFYFYYRTDDKYLHHAMVTKPLVYCDKIDDEVVCAPTISQVLKWLREEKKIHIATGYSNVSKWRYIIIHLGENFVKEANVWEKGFESYEQAALAGIEYVLNNLI